MCNSSRELKIFAVMLLPMLLLATAQVSPAAEPDNAPAAILRNEIIQQLATLPYYDVFDYITFSVSQNNNVLLSGDVTRPGLKRDAEEAVKRVKGTQGILDKIEILPKSPLDDSIRWEAFKAIFEKPALQKYATQSVDPLRIVVKNGEIILDGRVANRFDKAMIEDCARSVTKASGVIDDLTIRS
jgi:hyperosmotically inducible protein